MRIPEYHRKNSERYALSFSVTETVAPTSVPPHPENPRPVIPYTFGDQEQYAWAIWKQSELHESK